MARFAAPTQSASAISPPLPAARPVVDRIKADLASVNVIVSIDTLVIAPGDIVVGDRDGLVAFPRRRRSGQFVMRASRRPRS